MADQTAAASDPWAQFNPVAAAPAAAADPWADFNPIAAPKPLMQELQDIPKGAVHGLMDLPVGGAQLVTGGQSDTVNNYAKEREQGIPNTPGYNLGRVVGNMVAGAPLAYMMPGAAAEGLAARVGSGIASGALNGAMQPATPGPDFLEQKGEQATLGGLGGAAGPVIGGAAARVISPNVSPDVKLLINEGITPTTGSILGGYAKAAEDKLSSLPIGIDAARLRAVQQFNQAAINRSLGHIGQSADTSLPAGRAQIADMHDKITNAYNDLLPQLQWQADPQFVQNVSAIRQNAVLPPPQQAQFDSILKNQFSKVPANGVTDGDTYKGIEGTIKSEASGYSNSSVYDERKLGSALQGVQTELKSALTRSNPQYAPQLSAIDSAYADMLRVQGAASRQGAFKDNTAGIFSPEQLSSSVRELDPSLRSGAFGRGQARMQDLSDAGKTVLGNNIPDSGTAGRLAMMGAVGSVLGGGEMAQVPPSVLIPAAVGGAVGMGAYTRPAQATLAALLARRPDVAAPIASVVRKASPAASSGLASILAQQSTAPPAP